MASSSAAPSINAEASSSAAPTITAEASSAAAANRAAIPPSPLGPRPAGIRTKSSKRSRSGCFTCRLRRKKCDEERPACKTCLNYGLRCEYRPPLWWSTGDQRRRQRDRVKDRIRQTKLMQKEGALQDYIDRIKELATKPAVTQGLGNLPTIVQQPQVMMATIPSPITPNGVTITTDQQTFINNNPVPQGTAVSTVNPVMGPPPMLNTPISPQFHNSDWLRNEMTFPDQLDPIDITGSEDKPLSTALHSLISVEDKDQALFDHFVDHVLKLAFPILEIYRGGPGHITEVLGSMQSNRSYLHCCLSAAAAHLKTSHGMEDQMDHDIVEHRWSAISSLSRSLDRGSGHSQIMDATLALIFYDCSIGTSDDYLPDVPWTTHFSAVTNIVKRLSCMPSRFNITVITWIDILGSTMLGETPQFSHTYRTKHMSATPSGLQQLMGCDDRVMYVISEIACLESLKKDGLIDDDGIFGHVSALNVQLDWTESRDPNLQPPYGPNGEIRPEMLTKIISSIFRIAARLYLFSLIRTFDHFEPTITNLVASVAEILQYLPTGPNGYDRCLVWPLFMIGVYSVPSSVFRRALTERVVALGYLGDFGSFGRMYRVLREIWKVTNQTPTTPTNITTNTESQQGQGSSESTQPTTQQAQPGTIQQVHWREVMKDNDWNFLLM